jgi:phosphoglycolate phosphatase
MNIKAVLFDLDGTLLDTIDDLTDSVNAVLAGWGLPTHDRATYKWFVGDGVKILITRSLPESMRTDERINEGMVKMRQEYSTRWNNKTRPYSGVGELLDELTKRNIRMTILSNKPDDFTKLMVRTYLPKWSFDVVLGSREGVALKPNPAAALEVASALHLQPHDFAYLGDTRTGMETALGAKMYPVGVLWGFRPAEELTKSGAAALIDHPLDFLRLLDVS